MDFPFAFFNRKTVVFLFAISTTLLSNAQSVSPGTVNISGQSASFGNYQFEWSVGESAAVTTLSNGNLVVTSGVLQPFGINQPTTYTMLNWLPEDVKIYPNPTRDIIEINMLSKLSGRSKFELFDLKGNKLMEKQFDYNGTGSSEKWDLSKYAAGQYFLNIQLVNSVTGRVVKKGAFRILKIQ